ncbi:MAG: LptA/OstA family protein [Desulfosalsimonas sp.]
MKIFDILAKKAEAAVLSALSATAFLILLMGAGPVCADQNAAGPVFDAGGGEIRITSDRMIMHSGQNTAEFIGNVDAVQDATRLQAGRMKIFYKSGATSGMQNSEMDEDAVERIDAEDDVVIDSENTTAIGDKAVYTAEDGILKLFGIPARLERSDSVITGKIITVNRRTGEVIVSGDDKDRVEAVFTPAQEQENDE